MALTTQVDLQKYHDFATKTIHLTIEVGLIDDDGEDILMAALERLDACKGVMRFWNDEGPNAREHEMILLLLDSNGHPFRAGVFDVRDFEHEIVERAIAEGWLKQRVDGMPVPEIGHFTPALIGEIAERLAFGQD